MVKLNVVQALLATALAALVGRTHADRWAILVCGSRGYFNYRHHADVCHAYHSLRERGIPDDHIITMMYDDVADSRMNPFPGQLFNRPNDQDSAQAIDVYKDCKKDYTKYQVTPTMFLNVIEGNEDETEGGPVLKSTAEDDVFINFVDHGAPNLVAFPRGELHARQLMRSIQRMHDKKMFRNLVFYMEACESGSMFRKLPTHLNVWAVTAANAHESSFATYCPPAGDLVNGKHLHTCLGDEFSVHWMEDTDAERPGQDETLEEQFARVQNATTKSHVLDFGDLATMSKDAIDEFLGAPASDGSSVRELPRISAAARDSQVDSRDVALVSKFFMYASEPTQENAVQLQAEVEHRRAVDATFAQLAAELLDDPRHIDAVLTARGEESPQEYECHRAANSAYKNACTEDGAWSDYSIKYSATLEALCERFAGRGPYKVVEAIRRVCAVGAQTAGTSSAFAVPSLAVVE
ncbi:Vacuolar-processing enzyme [Hondaea fermentalgiana]|uniref:legumain n=1 Tax=Hondaea fermentalgiana TaxID=2315210 RepID=A0A2R5G7W0_9STRA|nr:Vacuolar-processing enzyme [Hondaea fermentalgiana]|eukprot:GBG24573.1 Vacuolar-processing enzyme [Hondaea fermentalgiana]